MSDQAARAFIERMKSDEALRARVSAAQGPAEFLKLVEAEGPDCSAEEIVAQASRLEEADLEVITAGDSGSEEDASDPWGHPEVHTGIQLSPEGVPAPADQ